MSVIKYAWVIEKSVKMLGKVCFSQALTVDSWAEEPTKRHKGGFQMLQFTIGWKWPQRVKRPNSIIADQGSGFILLSLLYPVHVPCMELPNLFDTEIVCLEGLRMERRQWQLVDVKRLCLSWTNALWLLDWLLIGRDDSNIFTPSSHTQKNYCIYMD